MQVTAVFDVGDSTIACSRRLAAAFLTSVQPEHPQHLPTHLQHTTQLVVSELLTNARRHAPGPALLILRITDQLIEIAVWDSSPHLPAARTYDPERISRHGLEIVTALTERLEACPEAGGKRITAHIPLAPAVQPAAAAGRPVAPGAHADPRHA